MRRKQENRAQRAVPLLFSQADQPVKKVVETKENHQKLRKKQPQCRRISGGFTSEIIGIGRNSIGIAMELVGIGNHFGGIGCL